MTALLDLEHPKYTPHPPTSYQELNPLHLWQYSLQFSKDQCGMVYSQSEKACKLGIALFSALSPSACMPLTIQENGKLVFSNFLLYRFTF